MGKWNKGVFVTATDTEVGKTFISALLVSILIRQGVKCTYYKPVATGCTIKDGSLVSEDLSYLRRFTQLSMEENLHCPVRYEKPLSPLAAAQLEGRELDLAAIRMALRDLQSVSDCMIVEGIGGVMVPLKKNYFVLDLIAEMKYPALVVARPTLGTINHTLLTLSALRTRQIPIIGFLTNGKRDSEDEAAMTSPELISELSNIAHLGHIPFFDEQRTHRDAFLDEEIGFLTKMVRIELAET
jgi:dethiobiotin synthetase